MHIGGIAQRVAQPGGQVRGIAFLRMVPQIGAADPRRRVAVAYKRQYPGGAARRRPPAQSAAKGSRR